VKTESPKKKEDAKLDPQNSVFQQNRENSRKNACRVCLRYLRYASTENSKGFPESFPGSAVYVGRVKFSTRVGDAPKEEKVLGVMRGLGR
jgi:hypothetical protein